MKGQMYNVLHGHKYIIEKLNHTKQPSPHGSSMQKCTLDVQALQQACLSKIPTIPHLTYTNLRSSLDLGIMIIGLVSMPKLQITSKFIMANTVINKVDVQLKQLNCS